MQYDAPQESISIHSLRVEGDRESPEPFKLRIPFQSTPSVWRETVVAASNNAVTPFQSTPSVWRETSDELPDLTCMSDFNPLPPCGGRPLPMPSPSGVIHFNPLPPCGGRQTHQLCQL